FIPLLHEGRPRDTGETYAFDADGLLLSESRFDDELRRSGALRPDQSGMLQMVLRTPTAGAPLTRAAERAIRGEPGMDLDGYNDYRGVPVVGAWVWSRALEMGVATEIDVVEALRSLRVHQALVHALTVLGAVLLIGLGALSLRSRQKLEEINESLERRVEE